MIELEEAAAWRLRQVDADPDDHVSAAAAALLQRLAEALRAQPDMALLTELHALCNWLAESDAIGDYAQAAQTYRSRIGVDEHPTSAEEYVRMLLHCAQQMM
ncbi:MAG: hypothetical protein KGI51_01315 [Rhodospirillales bacterium]|nr:hypothetical protein [Rhodospirillales bacterium]